MSTTVKTGINLFPHNQAAYEAAVSMLAETGKAAIIHPTGTGKSFIGFKLAEDYPEAVVCWLSPSEYIFKTQIENLIATGAEAPSNVVFFTYAKLMLMSEDELAEINPAYIILDEFHRCGAEMWGKGVQNLLDLYPNVPLLGLSATNIRYLDNQRDMADELFDGNIASEMTLGEAIVRGILNPPTYVTAMYGYQKTFEKYGERIKSCRNKAVRRDGEKELEKLRRALEKADGLDTIFEKHITEKSGKYIVFCANKEHMDDMVSHVPEWFSNVDRKPHIYRAYSSDPETSKAFADFKKDSSNSLKLLFAIDMLNEGVHVDDISGVILFRPTVSPIIFKQQIGRALCAGKKRNAVILDIVDNISNLYSIGAIQEEMQAAITYYHYLGENDYIVNDSFKIIDEVHDCRALFDELENTLSIPWDAMFREAENYYKKNGDLLVQKRYKTVDGLPLGQWVHTQRRAYWGVIQNRITPEQIRKLNSIGMVWDRSNELSWERFYLAAKKYYEENGNLKVPAEYETEDGLPLGDWISHQRNYRASNRNSALTEERIKRLDEIGMRWDAINYQWEENYQECVSYYKEHGNLMIPSTYVSPKGLKIGQWIVRLRRIKYGTNTNQALSTEQIERLDRIGMIWNTEENSWNENYERARSYYTIHGNLNVLMKEKSPDGFALGQWINVQRRKQKNGELPDARKVMLDEIGMVWSVEKDSWTQMFAAAKTYYETNGNLNVPTQYITADGLKLGIWISNRKQNKDKLSKEKVGQLEAIGMKWESKADLAWDEKLSAVKRYYREYGNIEIPMDYFSEEGYPLNAWLNSARVQYRKGKLSPIQIHELERLGILWNVLDDKWMQMYREAERFYREHGHLNSSRDMDKKLSAWLCSQRKNRMTMSDERKTLLDGIGMSLDDGNDTRWNDSFEVAKSYYLKNGNLSVPASYVTADGNKLGSWVSDQRKRYKNGQLSDDRIKRLEEIGMVWVANKASKSEGKVAVPNQVNETEINHASAQ